MRHDDLPPLVTEQTFGAVIRAFLESGKFRGYSGATRDLWGRELRLAMHPATLGAVPRDEIRPALVQGYLDGLSEYPGKQTAAYSAIKQVEKWAVVRDLLPRPICTGLEITRPDGGHIPWTEAQVEIAQRHAAPHLARAVTLAANTGQRGSDLVRMCWTDVEAYGGRDGINVTQRKTGKQIWVPITEQLAAAMATWPRRPGPFLVRPDGRPWTRYALTLAWQAERERNSALRPLGRQAIAGKNTHDDGLVIHGLRGFACVRLKRANIDVQLIADMVGMSLQMVAKYCRLSLQKENATAAIEQLEHHRNARQNLAGRVGGK